MAKVEGIPLKPFGFVVAYLFLVGGLVLTVMTATTKFGDLAKQQRLRADGIAVVGTVVGHKSGSRQMPEQIRIGYQAQGNAYLAWIKDDESSQERLWLWFDPADPAEFVTEHGITDDSLGFFNTWAGMPWGLVLFAIGAVSVVLDRRARQAARTAAARGRRRTRKQ